jgi:hypothetical protein
MLFEIKILSFLFLNLFNIVFAAITKTEPNDVFLTHYWPFENGQMIDQIGFKIMSKEEFITFTSDRFGCPGSALALNRGYTQVDQGSYFDTPEFTISVWVYPRDVGSWARVIDFHDRFAKNNVILSLDSGSLNRKPALQIYSNYFASKGEVISQNSLNENQWQFLTTTFDGSTMFIYINGVLTGSQSFKYQMPLIIRAVNYIGESWNSWNDGESESFLDDLRFYRKSLNKTEINYLMNLPGKIKYLTSTKSSFSETFLKPYI